MVFLFNHALLVDMIVDDQDAENFQSMSLILGLRKSIVAQYSQQQNELYEMWELRCKGMRDGARYILQWIVRVRRNSEFDFCYACVGGHRELVDLLIEQGADYWNFGLYGACRGGHRGIVELMIEKGAYTWNFGLAGACFGGNYECSKKMIEQGADFCSQCSWSPWSGRSHGADT